jgi:hypothetical protein
MQTTMNAIMARSAIAEGPMAKKQPTKKPSGGARLKTQGKSLVWSAYTDDEKQILRTAASFEGMSMAKATHDVMMAWAQDVLKRIRKG